jgi:hypothetical protein
MPGPDAYPEMILAAAQEEIEALAHERARARARRAVRRPRRTWRQNRVVRCVWTLF